MNMSTYYRSVLGAAAGLVTWFIQAVLSSVSSSEAMQLILRTALFAGLLAGVNVAARDHYTTDRVRAGSLGLAVVTGATLGALLGLLLSRAGGLGGALGGKLFIVVVWGLAGVAAGACSGLSWPKLSREQVTQGVIGGVIGGLVGALIQLACDGQGAGPFATHFFVAAGYVGLAGASALAVAMVPVLAASGVLRFVDSGDPITTAKLTVHDTIPVGKEPVVVGRDTQPIPEASTVGFVPDAAVAPNHFVIRNERGAFELRYPTTNILDGRVLAPAKVDGQIAGDGHLLRDGAEILIGRTRFQFQHC